MYVNQATNNREISSVPLDELQHLANSIREASWGEQITFSPKVFLPITNLCRNYCDYCSFRRSPGQAGEWTMTPDQIEQSLEQARQQGCIEALLCLGDTPETSFESYKNLLKNWGFSSTVEYLYWACKRALSHGLLPHTNAGILNDREMKKLKEVNVSLGLMLENSSKRLRQRGQAHHRAPDKDPSRRLKMLEQAGELQIPFTTGILVGIGETRAERIQSLCDIAELHKKYGHIQEVIVQNFRAHPSTKMANSPEATQEQQADTLALARIILPPDISVQTPPNLNPATTALLLDFGLNDLGGISPVTPDYINPNHPWPHLQELSQICANSNRQLVARLPVYPSFIKKNNFLHPTLFERVYKQQKRLKSMLHPWELSNSNSSTKTYNLRIL